MATVTTCDGCGRQLPCPRFTLEDAEYQVLHGRDLLVAHTGYAPKDFCSVACVGAWANAEPARLAAQDTAARRFSEELANA